MLCQADCGLRVRFKITHVAEGRHHHRQTEVQNLCVPTLHENVSGLDVTVNDALGVGSVERVGNLDAQR